MSRKRVITERDIRRAKADGKSSIDVGDAVVTPSAREVAAVLRITLAPANAEAREASPARRPPPSHVKGRTQERGPRGTSQRPDAEKAGRRGESRGGTNPGTAPSPSKPDGAAATSPRVPGASSASAAPAAAAGTAGARARPSVAIGADHGGVGLKAVIAKRLKELGHDVADVGTNSTDPVDYPDFAEMVARMVGEGRAAFGIMIDGAGIGSCMAANKVARVRAAMCYDVTTAVNAREHNFANVLTLGAGLIGERLALTIVETFLSTPTGAERHAARVAKIDALDRRG